MRGKVQAEPGPRRRTGAGAAGRASPRPGARAAEGRGAGSGERWTRTECAGAAPWRPILLSRSDGTNPRTRFGGGGPVRNGRGTRTGPPAEPAGLLRTTGWELLRAGGRDRRGAGGAPTQQADGDAVADGHGVPVDEDQGAEDVGPAQVRLDAADHRQRRLGPHVDGGDAPCGGAGRPVPVDVLHHRQQGADRGVDAVDRAVDVGGVGEDAAHRAVDALGRVDDLLCLTRQRLGGGEDVLGHAPGLVELLGLVEAGHVGAGPHLGHDHLDPVVDLGGGQHHPGQLDDREQGEGDGQGQVDPDDALLLVPGPVDQPGQRQHPTMPVAIDKVLRPRQMAVACGVTPVWTTRLMSLASASAVVRLLGWQNSPHVPPPLAEPWRGDPAPLIAATRRWMSWTPSLSGGSLASIRTLLTVLTVPSTVWRTAEVSLRDESTLVSLELIDVRAAMISSAWPGMGLRAGSMPARAPLMRSTWLGRVTTLPPAPTTARWAVARLPLMEARELVMTIR